MMLLALAIDAVLGWPAPLFARIGHPVTWLGRLITALEAALNHAQHRTANRRLAGALTVAVVIACAVVPAAVVQILLPGGVWGVVVGAMLAWPLIAARSLYSHVAAVAQPLARGDLAMARGAVAMIVGRDPAQLDSAGVARAALESLAENTSDGIVAPLFWGVLLGLPGIAAYKAINTMDSMIAHRSPRYEDFGKLAARLDDVVNLIPARLTGLIFVLVSGRAGSAFGAMRADAGKHRSPNAGWPEAAMAGALGVRLSGPRRYGDQVADEPWLNGAADDPGPRIVTAGLALYRRAMIAVAVILAALALL